MTFGPGPRLAPSAADRRLFFSETVATARKLLTEYADGVPF